MKEEVLLLVEARTIFGVCRLILEGGTGLENIKLHALHPLRLSWGRVQYSTLIIESLSCAISTLRATTLAWRTFSGCSDLWYEAIQSLCLSFSVRRALPLLLQQQ